MKQLLARYVPPEWRDSIDGDLEEVFQQRVEAGMPRFLARFLGTWDALGVVVRFARAAPKSPRRQEARMDSLRQDLVFTVRSLGKSPGFTAVAVFTLALGIGANILLFAVVDTLLLRPLPFVDAERLTLVWSDHEKISAQLGSHELPVNAPTFLTWRRENDVFEDLAAMRTRSYTTRFDATPQRIVSVATTPSLFPILGVQPAIGRTFHDEEAAEGRHRVALIGHDLWQTRFGATTEIVGMAIELNDEPYEIVGVLPQGFRFPENKYLPAPYQFPEKTELWTPLVFDAQERERGRAWNLSVVGRLAPGVSFERAGDAMNAIAASIEEARPENTGWRVRLEPFRGQMVGRLEPTLLLLAGTVAMVLLLACVNIANLLLSRATSRESELAVRAALGGTRGRILKQLLTESFVLGAAGGIAALAVLAVFDTVWTTMIPSRLPFAEDIGIDARVAGFAFAISVVASLFFGVTSGMWALGTQAAQAIHRGSRTTRSGGRLGSFLVISEVALCLVLLAGAGLLLRSFREVTRVDPGFRAEKVLTMELQLPTSKYDGSSRTRFVEELTERIEALPGVVDASAATNVPLAGAESGSEVIVEGRPDPGRGQRPHSFYYETTPAYFQTLGIPLLQGRALRGTDRADTPGVAVVSESFADAIFPGEDAVGQRMRFAFNRDDEGFEIVGVVGDVRMASLESPPKPVVYLPHQQMRSPMMFLAVRADIDAAGLTGAIRDTVRAIDPDQPVAGIATMDERVESSLAARGYLLSLLSAFALVALALATVGIYGVIAASVARRTREMGIRVALGARRHEVLGLVLRRGVALAAAGAAVGLVGALALSRMLTTFLFGVSPFDPLTFAGVTGILFVCAMAASYVPAARATAVDPVRALRHE